MGLTSLTVASATSQLVNSARAAVGKAPVGWINPALYATSSQYVFDITKGTNKCVSAGSVCCNQGYTAGPGWDPVTGLVRNTLSSHLAIRIALTSLVMWQGSLNVTALINTFVALGNRLPRPTKAPSSLATSLIPTVDPTPSPTMAPGWMYITTYSGEGCAGEVTDVTGIATGVCMVEYASATKAVGSRKHYCDGSKIRFICFNSLVAYDHHLV